MPTLKIFIPNYCTSEVTYSFDVLFTCIQFSDYSFSVKDDLDDFIIASEQDNHIVKISNHFFQKDMIYHENLIPVVVKEDTITVKNQPHPIIPLFGKPFFDGDTLDLDLVASTFFMASRWEEKVKSHHQDIHGRFDETKALSVLGNFIDRPVINEYALLLHAILRYRGIDINYTIAPPDIKITFDIDYIFKWKYWKSLIGNLIRKGPSLKDKISYLSSFLQVKFLNIYHADPFYSFYYILNIFKRYQTTSIFYFMVDKTDDHWDLSDYALENRPIREALDIIIAGKHSVGLHSSYRALESHEKLISEKQRLENFIGLPIDFIRPHFLRILPESGLSVIHLSGFKNESGMLYSRHFGFRCGCTFALPYFDMDTLKKTDLMMIPTLAMSSIGLENNFVSQKNTLIDLILKMKKYGGQAQIIWHNSDLDTVEKKRFFEKIMDIIYT